MFDIGIIGAGIAGLAAAIPLARQGHRITIYESNMTLSELGAGLQLQPNSTRVICHWGLREAFLAVVNMPAVMKVMRYADNHVIGELPHNPQQTWEFGFPHWQCYRPDLQRLLYDAAVDSGVDIKFGRKVANVDVEKGILEFVNGEKVESDLVVVADGISSRIREFLPGNLGIKAQSRNEFCFRTVIDREKMDADPETAILMKGHDNMVWCGPGVAVLGYPVSGGSKYNTLISCPHQSDVPVGRWDQQADPAEARKIIKEFSPLVQKVWSCVDDCVKWELGEVPCIESYVSKSGRCVLVGDAAHAIVPHAGQGGGMAIEDAAALAAFVEGSKSVSDLTRTMPAYQAFRQPRIENLRRMAKGDQAFMSLPDGPQQEQRDKMFSAMTAKWKSELAELGESGIRARPRPRAEALGNFSSPESREYMLAYNVLEEAARTAAKL